MREPKCNGPCITTGNGGRRETFYFISFSVDMTYYIKYMPHVAVRKDTKKKFSKREKSEKPMAREMKSRSIYGLFFSDGNRVASTISSLVTPVSHLRTRFFNKKLPVGNLWAIG